MIFFQAAVPHITRPNISQLRIVVTGVNKQYNVSSTVAPNKN